MIKTKIRREKGERRKKTREEGVEEKEESSKT